MEYAALIHELILEHVRKRLSREYKEIKINKAGRKEFAYQGHYPDMILGSHGMVLALLEVETAESISEKQAENWKALSGLGLKLILMIPKDMKVRVTELLWSKGMMDKVSIGTYEIAIQMP
jgi:hypothetical protein